MYIAPSASSSSAHVAAATPVHLLAEGPASRVGSAKDVGVWKTRRTYNIRIKKGQIRSCPHTLEEAAAKVITDPKGERRSLHVNGRWFVGKHVEKHMKRLGDMLDAKIIQRDSTWLKNSTDAPHLCHPCWSTRLVSKNRIARHSFNTRGPRGTLIGLRERVHG